MAEITDFTALAMHGLRDIYDAENQAVAAYPSMIEAASSSGLKSAFQEHLQQSQGQIQRLEQIFQNMGGSSQGVTCQAATAIIAEAQEKVKIVEAGPLLDAALIAGAQKLEHLEIAAYGTAVTFAGHLGDQNAISLLNTTLEEEKTTDKKLTALAENNINEQAASQ